MTYTYEDYIKTLEERLSLKSYLIGAIAGLYGIPLAEINELEKRIKDEATAKEMKKADAQEAARKKFNKLMTRFKVVSGNSKGGAS